MRGWKNEDIQSMLFCEQDDGKHERRKAGDDDKAISGDVQLIDERFDLAREIVKVTKSSMDRDFLKKSKDLTW